MEYFTEEEAAHLATKGTSAYYAAPAKRDFPLQGHQAQHARISLAEMNKRWDALGPNPDPKVVHGLRHLAGLDW